AGRWEAPARARSRLRGRRRGAILHADNRPAPAVRRLPGLRDADRDDLDRPAEHDLLRRGGKRPRLRRLRRALDDLPQRRVEGSLGVADPVAMTDSRSLRTIRIRTSADLRKVR